MKPRKWWGTRRVKADTHTKRVRDVQRRGVWPKMNIERSITTVFMVTALHPKDGHEFGIAVPMSGAPDELPDDKLGAVIRSMNDYMKNHP